MISIIKVYSILSTLQPLLLLQMSRKNMTTALNGFLISVKKDLNCRKANVEINVDRQSKRTLLVRRRKIKIRPGYFLPKQHIKAEFRR